MTSREVDEQALDRAVRATGLMRSSLRVAVRAYLDGVTARSLAKNPRLALLAGMALADVVEWPYGDSRGQLQSLDKQRARVLMGRPDADWKLKTLPGVRKVAARVTRIA